MNLLVIGHSVVDNITYRETRTTKPGGIFYSALALKSFAGENDTIFLCTSLDRENHQLFSSIYGQVEQDYISRVEKIPIVNLTVYSGNERHEKYGNLAGNLNTELKHLPGVKGILINMITGYDITIKQIQELRNRFSCDIYFDVHTLSRGVDENMNRNFRVIPDFEEWAKCIDILQANEKEIKTLFPTDDDNEIIKMLFKSGIKQVIVTRADKGVTIYFKKDCEIKSHLEQGIKVKVLNKVGCGDVFGGVYFYNYIRNKDIMKALKLADIAGGLSATYSNVSDYLRLKKDVYQRLSET